MRFNEFFVFPFESVNKDSDIIIYGMGNVGKCYYNQVTTLKYCNVIANVDKAAEEYGINRYNIIKPEHIQNYSYDHLVIALASEVAAKQVKKELIVNYGVQEDKIVITTGRKVALSLSATTLEQWLASKELLQKELNHFWMERIGDVNYFSEIAHSILRLKAEHKEDKVSQFVEYIKEYLAYESSVRNKIVILRIMYMAGCFDAELMQIFLKEVSKLDNYDARMWFLYDISVIEGNEPQCRYENYYIDKRKLMEYTAKNYYTVTGHKKKCESNRVAIISFTLGNERSSHNALIVPYANEMVKQGREVTIFPMDLFRYRYGESFIQPIVPLEQRAENHVNTHEKILDLRVNVYYNDGESIRERICNLMEALIKYNPSVVYDFCGEYSFLSPLINKLFYVIALPIRGYASSACFDIYMCRDKELCVSENSYYHSVDEKQMVEALVCSEQPMIPKGYRREDYGIAEDAFIITTVGERLKNELTIEFVDCVCGFLIENPETVWILVGEKIGNYAKENYHELFENRQIMEWGYEKNLLSFYALCDIYWNPARMGAGGSIAGAMRCGLPIVTTDFPSDILPRIGRENVICGGYTECRKYVEKLFFDSALYKEKSELMKARMQVSGIPEYVQILLDVGEKLQ